ncbi:MAG: sugar transferase [Bacteroidota bacterium]
MKIRTKISLISIDIVLLLMSFSLTVAAKPSSGIQYFREYAGALAIFILLWLVISIITKKLDAGRFKNIRNLNITIAITNLVILALCVLLMYSLRDLQYSRFIVFGTILLTTIFELILAYFYFYLKHAKTGLNGSSFFQNHSLTLGAFNPVQEKEPNTIEPYHPALEKHRKIDQSLIAEVGKEVYDFIGNYVDLSNGSHIIFSTATKFNIDKIPDKHYTNLVNLKRINDIRYINKFFESVNTKIPEEGLFVGCAETKEQRKQRILRKYPPGFNTLYYMLDFIVKRIFPKFVFTKKIYFFLTRGNNRVISKAETLGRLYSCGFEIEDKQTLKGNLYFVARKKTKPAFDNNPTYGPFIKLPRIGKHGKIIYVYKFRTMHPFSEYLQNYVYSNNNLQNGGKFSNDFRITTLGKIFRMFWIDELPMLINLLKGEMKLVGVRPLSRHYFNLYSKELQQERIKHTPGLIPPFYADLPETLEEIQESELKYLESYKKRPLLTDWKYFWKAFFNIFFKKQHSC